MLFRSVLDAAGQAFMTEGYRASIDHIAAAAGVAKQTLYNHFPSKEALFEEVVRNGSRQILVTLEAEDGDLRTNLTRFAVLYRQKVLCPHGLGVFRTLVAEMPRFPQLSRTLFEAGPRETMGRLAKFLARAMERGELRQEDPIFAADMLTAMLANYERLRGLLTGDTNLLDDAKIGRAHV